MFGYDSLQKHTFTMITKQIEMTKGEEGGNYCGLCGEALIFVWWQFLEPGRETSH